MIKTGGVWDPSDWPIYFVATNPEQLDIANYDRLLVAVNELENEADMAVFRKLADGRRKLFVDSGVFNLAMKHATAHGVTHDVALSTAPDQIDGFADLFDHYVSLVRECGDRIWGYVEIDQGGRDNKIKTRKRLEDLGLRPVPVYHPLNDGWDYFDYLAQNYDRICFGNVVNANINVRKRLVATAWERRRKYPHLWIHLLGLSPSELTVAYPVNSCDSSTWIAAIRWAQMKAYSATGTVGYLDLEWAYKYRARATKGKWNDSYVAAIKMCGYEAGMTTRTMQNIADDYERAFGADIGMFE